MALVHDDSICHGGGDKGEAVGKDGPRGVVVEGDERKRIAEDGKEQSQVSTSVVSDLDPKILARSTIMDELFGPTYPTNQANLQKKKAHVSIQIESIEASGSCISFTDRRITYCRVWARAFSLSARGRLAGGGGAMG